MSEEMNNNEQVQTNEETLNQVKESVVENLEESSVKELDALREDNNSENQKVVDDAQKKLSDIFEDLRNVIRDNSDPEKIKENFNNSRENVLDILENTRKKAVEVSNSDNFKQTIDAGKDFLEGAGGMISDGFKAGADLLMSNDNIADFVNKANARLDVLRDSEGLKKGVDAAEELTNKVNQSVFGAIQKFFDKKGGEE